MKLPIIGITTYGRDEPGRFYLPGEYVDAVRIAGGLPILLPPGESNPDQILELVDALVFAGGGDIEPDVYGGKVHSSISHVDTERDTFELALARKMFLKDKPTLGICRGFQLLNVADGGDLVEHIPDEFGLEIIHRSEDGGYAEHLVQIVSGSRLGKIIGATEISVMSKHHQALRTIPSGWRIVARASDGMIEALEHKKHPWMFSVLWHPECLLDDPYNQRIFQALVEAAGVGKTP